MDCPRPSSKPSAISPTVSWPIAPTKPAAQSIRDGKLSPEIYYQHLLRLIYRLLFLLVIEERDLIFPPTASRQQRDIFRRYYSVERLRLLSEKRHLADKRFHDHWLGLLATFRLFEAHGPGEKLGVAPLAGDLFSPAAIGPWPVQARQRRAARLPALARPLPASRQRPDHPRQLRRAQRRRVRLGLRRPARIPAVSLSPPASVSSSTLPKATSAPPPARTTPRTISSSRSSSTRSTT
jgi:hypothetical protein